MKKESVKISIVGSGYVGLVSGVCFAEIGHKVLCVDNNREKIASLKKGIPTIYEPGLEELMKKNIKRGRLSFSDSVKDATKKTDVIFIAVNTPPRPDGSADLQYVEAVSRQIAAAMDKYKVIVEKSTVPAQTGQKIKQTIEMYNKKKIPFDVVSNPEFLREGSAINDFMKPDRIVVGCESSRAAEIMQKIYAPVKAPFILTSRETAELIKHASNSFLAMKISYINAVANIAERVGANIMDIARGMGLDKRISPHFLSAGVGFGGSCFPKDVLAFIHMAEQVGIDFVLLKEVFRINVEQRKNLIKKIEEILWNIEGKKIAVWGLAFKPETDDLRNAPSLDIVGELLSRGAFVTVWDPVAMKNFKKHLQGKNLKFAADMYSAAKGADCLVVLTEWKEFLRPDFKKLKSFLRVPAIVDGRNIYNGEKLSRLGFVYKGMGV